MRPSMGSVGDAYDNAMAESFFASLECELIDRRSWQTKTEARLALFTYIEGWYNPRRRHSALGQTSPAVFEARHRGSAASQPQRIEHGITTVGVCVACATPPVDKSLPSYLVEPRCDISTWLAMRHLNLALTRLASAASGHRLLRFRPKAALQAPPKGGTKLPIVGRVACNAQHGQSRVPLRARRFEGQRPNTRPKTNV